MKIKPTPSSQSHIRLFIHMDDRTTIRKIFADLGSINCQNGKKSSNYVSDFPLLTDSFNGQLT